MSRRRTIDWEELIVPGIIVFYIIVYILLYIMKLPEVAIRWPKILIVTIGFLLIIGFKQIFMISNDKHNTLNLLTIISQERKEIVLLAVLVLYIWLLPKIGFSLSTGLQIAVLSRYLGTKKWYKVIEYAFAGALFFHLVFIRALQMPLPMLWGIF